MDEMSLFWRKYFYRLEVEMLLLKYIYGFILKNIHFIRRTNYVPLSHRGFQEWFEEQTEMLYELGRMSAKPTGFSK